MVEIGVVADDFVGLAYALLAGGVMFAWKSGDILGKGRGVEGAPQTRVDARCGRCMGSCISDTIVPAPERGQSEEFPHLFHHRQNPRLCIVVAVRSNSLRDDDAPVSFSFTSTLTRRRGDVMYGGGFGGTHQIDLIRTLVGPVRPGQAKECVLWGLGDGIGREAGGEDWAGHLVGDAAYPVCGVGGRRVRVVELLGSRGRVDRAKGGGHDISVSCPGMEAAQGRAGQCSAGVWVGRGSARSARLQLRVVLVRVRVRVLLRAGAAAGGRGRWRIPGFADPFYPVVQ